VIPEVREEGDEILYAWHELGVGLTYSRLRETDSGAIRGFLSAYSIRPDQSGPIWWSQVSLTVGADRDRVCKKLDGFGRSGKEWERDIDRCFQDCAERFLRIPEPLDLADVSAPLDTQYLIDPVAMLNQVNMLLADQGSTKSYLLLYLAVCIATGRTSIFGTPKVSGPVVYFDWEVDEFLQRRRLDWICRGMGIPIPRGVRYQNMTSRGRIMDRGGDMRQQIARLNAVAAIVDSLTFGAGGDLNATEISAPTVAAIGSLGDGVTKLVAAHPPKSSRRAAAEDDVSVIGSGLFEFRARSIWRMQAPPPSERGSAFIVSMRQRKISEGQHNGTVFYRINFDREAQKTTFSLASQGDDPTLAATTLPGTDRILAFLREHRGQANTATLARGLDMPANQVRTYAGRLVHRGMLVKIGGGEADTAVWGLLARGSNGSSNGVHASTDQVREDLPW
jgi:hypothetical protein